MLCIADAIQWVKKKPLCFFDQNIENTLDCSDGEKPFRKAAASEGWLQKAAEEADLIVDGEDDSDEEFYQVFAPL